MNPRKFTSPFRVVGLILLLTAVYVGVSSNLTHASAPAKTSAGVPTWESTRETSVPIA